VSHSNRETCAFALVHIREQYVPAQDSIVRCPHWEAASLEPAVFAIGADFPSRYPEQMISPPEFVEHELASLTPRIGQPTPIIVHPRIHLKEEDLPLQTI